MQCRSVITPHSLYCFLKGISNLPFNSLFTSQQKFQPSLITICDKYGVFSLLKEQRLYIHDDRTLGGHRAWDQ